MIEGEYSFYPQSADGPSYYGTGYIDYKNLSLNINCTADQIKRQVYAFAFRPYQLLQYNGSDIIGASITENFSDTKPGTLINEDETRIIISTIDYDIVLYKDILHKLVDSISNHDNARAKDLCVYKPIVFEREEHGWTPLTVAVYNNNFEMANYLVSIGADEKTVNYNGTTLLMYAKDAGMNTGDWSMFRWLIGLGLSVHEKDYNDKELDDYLSMDIINRVPKDVLGLIGITSA